MTDQEINEAIARRRGWEKEIWRVPGLPDSVIWKRGLYERQTVPEYCHLISVAWELCGPRFAGLWRSSNTKFVACFDASYFEGLFDGGVKNFPWSTEAEFNRECGSFPAAMHSNPAMAICLAYLKLPEPN